MQILEQNWFFAVIGLVLTIQFVMALGLYILFRINLKDINRLNKETYGLVKKIEVLTADRREHIQNYFDKLFEHLSKRLPHLISDQASEHIFQTESAILKRLAELEPNFKKDQVSQQKMNELIQSMESLEKTMVSLTANAVEKALEEERICFTGNDSVSSLS